METHNLIRLFYDLQQVITAGGKDCCPSHRHSVREGEDGWWDGWAEVPSSAETQGSDGAE